MGVDSQSSDLWTDRATGDLKRFISSYIRAFRVLRCLYRELEAANRSQSYALEPENIAMV